MTNAVRPKTRRFPPLNSLRVFEIAARCLSFTRAAQELNVTTAAVSHQIRLLEAHLNLKLFERENNVLTLTPSGEQYLPRIRDAFWAIEQATDAILNEHPAVLKVSVPPSFGARWLVPRLHRFNQRYPDLRIEIMSSEQPASGHADIVVGLQMKQENGMAPTPLITSDIFPVASANIASDLHAPDDLARFPLLHEENPTVGSDYPDWEGWLMTAKAQGVDPHQGSIFSLALLALEAAIDGQGVALAQRILVEADLAAGRLVRLFDIDDPHRIVYYLNHGSGGSSAPGFSEFNAWIAEEADSTEGRQNR